MAILTGKPTSISANTTSGTITLDTSEVLNLVDNVTYEKYWQDASRIKSILFVYRNSSRQKVNLKFTLPSTSSNISINQNFRNGALTCSKIVITGTANDTLSIPRSSFTTDTEFDIVVTDGYVSPLVILWEAVANNYAVEPDGGLTNGSGRDGFPTEYINSNTQISPSLSDIDLTFNVGNFPSNTFFGFADTESNSFRCGTFSLSGNSQLMYADNIVSSTGFALANKEFRITRTSNIVRMYHDGALVYTSPANAFGDIRPIASLATSGGSLISSTFLNIVL